MKFHKKLTIYKNNLIISDKLYKNKAPKAKAEREDKEKESKSEPKTHKPKGGSQWGKGTNTKLFKILPKHTLSI